MKELTKEWLIDYLVEGIAETKANIRNQNLWLLGSSLPEDIEEGTEVLEALEELKKVLERLKDLAEEDELNV